DALISGSAGGAAESHGLDLRHDLLLQPLEVVERLRDRYIGERRPEEQQVKTGLLQPLEVVGDLRDGPYQEVGALAERRLIRLLVRDRVPDHAADIEIVDRARALELAELLLDGAPPLLELVGSVLDPDPAREVVLRDAAGRASRVPEPAEV